MLLSGEKLLPVPKAVEIATGYRPDPSVPYRWGKIGVGKEKVKLETAMLGGRRTTSVEAVLRFIKATTLAADGEPVRTQANPQRQSEIDKAEAELAKDGI